MSEYRLAFFSFVMVVFLLGQAVRVMVDYWLSVWVDRKYHLSTRMYVISYACFVGGALILSIARALLFTEAALWSAKEMHNRMAERVLRSPQVFFDQVLISLETLCIYTALALKFSMALEKNVGLSLCKKHTLRRTPIWITWLPNIMIYVQGVY